MNHWCKKLRTQSLIANKMALLCTIVCLLVSFAMVPNTFAQAKETPLKIFGYFQNSFQQWTAFQERPKQNSFSLQQLNLFFQKDLGPNWTAFVDFEFLNNFSSSRQWGSFNLEEVWVKYRADMRFNLKLGLLIPIFNNLHEIKNRTPLLLSCFAVKIASPGSKGKSKPETAFLPNEGLPMSSTSVSD